LILIGIPDSLNISGGHFENELYSPAGHTPSEWSGNRKLPGFHGGISPSVKFGFSSVTGWSFLARLSVPIGRTS
jgi:hypothetical protein